MPRLKVDMSVIAGGEASLDYHRDLQGFIYRVLRETDYDRIHGKPGFKYFVFSNIFPPSGVFEEGDKKSFLVASPLKGLVESLADGIRKYLDGELVRIGNIFFRIRDVKMFRLRVDGSIIELRTETPVVVRIPRRLFSMYGIESDSGNVFWKPAYGFKAFENAVYIGLNKKYRDLYGRDLPTQRVFQRLQLIKTVSYKVRIKDRLIPIIGSLWRMWYVEPDKDLLKAINFMLDTGIGQRTSLGFGFINPVKH